VSAISMPASSSSPSLTCCRVLCVVQLGGSAFFLANAFASRTLKRRERTSASIWLCLKLSIEPTQTKEHRRPLHCKLSKILPWFLTLKPGFEEKNDPHSVAYAHSFDHDTVFNFFQRLVAESFIAVCHCFRLGIHS
jgi:hypothetical protein